MAENESGQPQAAPILPREVVTQREKSTYLVPLYTIDDTGLYKSREAQLKFVKGDKSNPEIFRQEGFMSETLLVAVQKYLQENNTGDLENHYTTQAIAKIGEALNSLEKRALDRIARGVQQTYNK